MNDSSRLNCYIVTTIAGIILFVLIVALLHLVQNGYNLQYQLISELATGKYGTFMFVAFLSLAAAVFGVQMSIGFFGATRYYRFLLNVVAIFFFLTGVFPLWKSPIIHILAITIAFVLSVISMYLFPLAAGQASIAAPRKFSWVLAFGVALSVAMGNYVIPIGIGQRLAACFLILWLLLIALNLFKIKRL